MPLDTRGGPYTRAETYRRILNKTVIESKLKAQGRFLEVLLGDKAHLLTDTIR
jgi:hypothetical protein